jgi:DNA replication protein DnaC/transposase
MGNVLSETKRQQVIALGRLGWSLRRIEQETGVRRETAGAYLKAAGISIGQPGGWKGRHGANPATVTTESSTEILSLNLQTEDKFSKPATEVTTDLKSLPVPSEEGRPATASSCEVYREAIQLGLSQGRNAMGIWQDLVDSYGFGSGYQSVKRFVRKLRGLQSPEARVVIETSPGEEAQVDYGSGPMVRDPQSGKYRRTRTFVLTLGYSRKSVRLLSFRSSTRIWAELNEKAFRRLGGSTRVVVLDNLKEGVLVPDIYDPSLNPLYRDVLSHYGVVALPCRIRDPDRKGKVESGVGHAKKTPLKGKRFESLEEAQAYLDHWEERWADTRIHGTTKRQVAAMFAEEKPWLQPLPLEPFRYYQYGDRTVHLDGCVEVDAAYYGAPPGWIGREVQAQWDLMFVRLLDPRTGQLLREHLRQKRGAHRIRDEDRPRRTPLHIHQLLARAHKAGANIGALCDAIHQRQAELGVRRILGVLSLVKKYGCAAADEACALALEMRVPEYRLRATLPGARPASSSEPAPSRSAHPRTGAVSRPDPTTNTIRGIQIMNLIELNGAMRQLRLSGMAGALETRLLQAQSEAMAPIDLISILVSDELSCRSERLLERRHKQARFRDVNKTLDTFDFQFNPKMNRALVFDLATAAFIGRREDGLFIGPPGSGKSHLAQAIGHAVILQGYRVLYREAHTLLEDLADATLDGKRKEYMELLSTVPLLIIDDLGMRKLPLTAAEELLEIIMRRYERTSTLLTSNRPVEDWGKLLGDSAAVTAMLDRLLHHGHVLKCGPRSWRTKSGNRGEAQ